MAANQSINLSINQSIRKNHIQVSRAVARKPRDAAAVLFGLKFADDMFNKSSQASKAIHKTEFNAKWRFKVIQSHVFWSQWKGDKALSNTI